MSSDRLFEYVGHASMGDVVVIKTNERLKDESLAVLSNFIETIANDSSPKYVLIDGVDLDVEIARSTILQQVRPPSMQARGSKAVYQVSDEYVMEYEDRKGEQYACDIAVKHNGQLTYREQGHGFFKAIFDRFAEYEAVLAQKDQLVRELDVALNGAAAAKQASLCDIVAQVKKQNIKATVEKKNIKSTGIHCDPDR